MPKRRELPVGESMNHLVRKPDAGNPPVRFDERGVETESTASYSGNGNRKGRSQLRLSLNSTAPLLDSTPPKAGDTPGLLARKGASRRDARVRLKAHTNRRVKVPFGQSTGCP
jgi:hypothetical protein